jgi:hypothetical protein
MLTETGFVDIQIGPPVDTFAGAMGDTNARTFEVYGYAFLARKPTATPTDRRVESGRSEP